VRLEYGQEYTAKHKAGMVNMVDGQLWLTVNFDLAAGG
jgi:hypothetical protein